MFSPSSKLAIGSFLAHLYKMRLTIELPPREEQLAFNQERWAAWCANPELTHLDGKFETDHNGNLFYMPPLPVNHNKFASRIMRLLDRCLGDFPSMECPVNTIAGIKVPDVVWFSPERWERSTGLPAHSVAPEICVEVVSPGNTVRELDEKRDWFFDAGADEVWRCEQDGQMQFFLKESPKANADASRLCPHFPGLVEL